MPITSGRVELGGRELTGAPPAMRARRGLGRTFQRMELFDPLSVAESVALAHEAALADGNPLRHLLPHRRDHAQVRERARQALARCGIEALAERRTGTLPTGQRRLVELARVLARRLLEFADYAYILNRGRITFAGEPVELAAEEVFDHYVGAAAG